MRLLLLLLRSKLLKEVAVTLRAARDEASGFVNWLLRG